MLKCWGSEPRSSILFNVDALGQPSFSKLKNLSSSQIFSYTSGSKLYPYQSLGGSDGRPKFWTSVAGRLVSVFYQIFASYFFFYIADQNAQVKPFIWESEFRKTIEIQVSIEESDIMMWMSSWSHPGVSYP